MAGNKQTKNSKLAYEVFEQPLPVLHHNFPKCKNFNLSPPNQTCLDAEQDKTQSAGCQLFQFPKLMISLWLRKESSMQCKDEAFICESNHLCKPVTYPTYVDSAFKQLQNVKSSYFPHTMHRKNEARTVRQPAQPVKDGNGA